jgi:hypothetical protein
MYGPRGQTRVPPMSCMPFMDVILCAAAVWTDILLHCGHDNALAHLYVRGIGNARIGFSNHCQ